MPVGASSKIGGGGGEMGKKSGKVRVALREVIRVYVAAGWGIHDCTAANVPREKYKLIVK